MSKQEIVYVIGESFAVGDIAKGNFMLVQLAGKGAFLLHN